MDHIKFNRKLKASRSRALSDVKKRLKIKKDKEKIKRSPRVTTKKNNKIALLKSKLQLYNENKDKFDDNEKQTIMVSIATEIQNIHRKSKAKLSRKDENGVTIELDDDKELKNKAAYDTAMDKIQKLKNHENNNMISLVGDAFMLDIPGTKSVYLSGCNPVLHKIFFPDTQDDPRLKDPDEVKRRQVTKNYHPSNNVKKTSMTLCKYSGKQHGTQVHNEIEFFTNIVAKESDMDKCVKQIKDPDPCTLKFIYHFMENNWTPVLSEFKIWDGDIAMATATDVILLDTTTWELILVELKTGYDGESYVSLPTDTFLKKPFNKLKHCPKTRHQFQLLFQKMVLEKKYKTKIKRCYVLRASSKLNKVESYPLMQWARNRDNQKLFYDKLVFHQNGM